jgi:hypothetical protein
MEVLGSLVSHSPPVKGKPLVSERGVGRRLEWLVLCPSEIKERYTSSTDCIKSGGPAALPCIVVSLLEVVVLVPGLKPFNSSSAGMWPTLLCLPCPDRDVEATGISAAMSGGISIEWSDAQSPLAYLEKKVSSGSSCNLLTLFKSYISSHKVTMSAYVFVYSALFVQSVISESKTDQQWSGLVHDRFPNLASWIHLVLMALVSWPCRTSSRPGAALEIGWWRMRGRV